MYAPHIFTPTQRPFVLIVDDNPETLRMYQEVLGPAGYQVALVPLPALAQSYGQYERPDLILLDWVFGQEGRGMQTLQQLVLWPATAGVPLLVCTVPVMLLPDLPAYLQAKGLTVVLKPFFADEVLSAIRTRLDNGAPSPASVEDQQRPN